MYYPDHADHLDHGFDPVYGYPGPDDVSSDEDYRPAPVVTEADISACHVWLDDGAWHARVRGCAYTAVGATFADAVAVAHLMNDEAPF